MRVIGPDAVAGNREARRHARDTLSFCYSTNGIRSLGGDAPMVFIKDEGSVFDAPIDVMWKYIQSPAHGQAHRSIRNRQTQPAGENTQLASMERNVGGSWVKVVNPLTILPPLGIAFEALEGPFAGSKFVYIYTPLGAKTGIAVYGEYASSQIPR